MNYEEGLHPDVTMLVPAPWTSSLQNCEEHTSVYKPPHLRGCYSSPKGVRRKARQFTEVGSPVRSKALGMVRLTSPCWVPLGAGRPSGWVPAPVPLTPQSRW